jgi:ABC-2 type transport system permease protein
VGQFRGLPKGDISKLWSLLGIRPVGDQQPEVIWQIYNPYPQYGEVTPELVFIRPELEVEGGPFNAENPITSGLEEVYLPFPGAIRHLRQSDLAFTRLIVTGATAGPISPLEFIQNSSNASALDTIHQQRQSREKFVLAAQIRGKAKAAAETNVALNADAAAAEAPMSDARQPHDMNVVYVADIDLLASDLVNIRDRPNIGDGVAVRFDNVTFVLNAIDLLAGEPSFLEIRKRKSKHTTLKVIEAAEEKAQFQEHLERQAFLNEFQANADEAKKTRDAASEKLKAAVEEFEERLRRGDTSVSQADFDARKRALEFGQAVEQRKFEVELERLERERDRKIAEIRNRLDLDVLNIQYQFKFWAVMLPWILPALVGLTVFVRRRLREREGITKSRLL